MPALMDVCAGERTIPPNEVEVMATEQEENNQIIATAEQEHQENNEKDTDETTPAPPTEVWWHQMSRSPNINNIIRN